MGKLGRDRGRNFEYAVAKFMGKGTRRSIFRPHDTEGHPLFVFECKKRKEHAKTLMKWWKQAVKATQEDRLPALVMAEYQQPVKNALCVIRLEDHRDLIDKAL